MVFGHNHLTAPVLSGVTLNIEPARHLALVGASGSGKSTLLKLLAGLSEPCSGQIRLNGQEVGTGGFASCGALLEQVPFFFSGTIEENLLEEPREEFLAALRLVGLEDALANRPDGLSTPLSGPGGGFSAGELQRLELARGLARRPGLLLLDESLCALESEAAVRILRALRSAGHAILHATQDPEALSLADEILVLEEGRIVERGPFESLARPGTIFHALTGA